MPTPDKSTASADERALVEMISHCANRDAGVNDTPADFAPPSPTPIAIKSLPQEAIADDAPTPMAAAKSEPDASALLDRPEDGFISALAIILVPEEERDKRRLAAIYRPFGYIRRVGTERIAVIAPTRYVTDFASIPGWARWAINPFGKHAEAAVIHDWLYAIGEEGNETERKRADDLFRVALADLKVNLVTRNAMHVAVRAGGRKAFGKSREFEFRNLETMTPIRPAPPRHPYLRTIAIKPVSNKAD